MQTAIRAERPDARSGESLSPAIGGWIAQGIGYSSTFVLLGSFALGSISLWLIFSSTLKAVCAIKV